MRTKFFPMRIDQATLAALGALFDAAAAGAQTGPGAAELEARLLTGGMVDRETARRVLQHLRARHGGGHPPPGGGRASDTLDVALVVPGLEPHAQVRMTAPISAPGGEGGPQQPASAWTAIRKRAMLEPVLMKEYGLKFNLKREEPVAPEDMPACLAALRDAGAPKHLRRKHRFSFQLAGSSFRADVTEVQTLEQQAVGLGGGLGGPPGRRTSLRGWPPSRSSTRSRSSGCPRPQPRPQASSHPASWPGSCCSTATCCSRSSTTRRCCCLRRSVSRRWPSTAAWAAAT